jgi:ferric-dicitrate binding protein FerR (iron transport regulator)
MYTEDYNKQLISAIAACLAGVAEEEERMLVEQWKNRSGRNRRLWQRLSAGNAWKREVDELDRTAVEEGWQRLERRMTRRYTLWERVRPLAGYAAVMAGLAVGFVLLREFKNAGEALVAVEQKQPEATTGVQLILADGRVIPINELGDVQIQEEDGATIYKDSTYIDYSRNIVQEDTVEIFNEMRMLNGMAYTITLSDGTRVYMNAESRLRFPVKFLGSRRVVEFEGEAYFSVAKNEERPFVIKTGGVEVAVLGTEFNLRAYSNETEIVTTLVSGKVQVSDDQYCCALDPGEQAVYATQTKELSTRVVDVNLYTAWCRAEILFKDTRLEDIMKNLARWYGIEYFFLDETAAELEFGGCFERFDSIDPILDMIRRTELLNVVREGNKIYFSIKK